MTGRAGSDEADKELAALEAIVKDPALPSLPASASLNTPDAILRIAPEVLAGEIAARRKDFDKALLHLERAVRLEDALDLHGAGRLARSRPAGRSARRCSKPAAPSKRKQSTGTT